MRAGPLSGRGIVVTRPREPAPALAERTRAAGGGPILFPTIEILLPENPGAVRDLIERLDGFQLAIFVSPTAAMRGHAMIAASRKWPESLSVAAVGIGTATALEERGIHAVIAPAGEADSEALAALPELQDLRGRSIVIFRGQGGREWLRTRLEERGARVEYAECYRRACPDADAGALLARWQSGGVEAVAITSAEGLANFFDMLGPTGSGYLRATPVFVPHPRIALAARRLDVREIVVTGRGDDRTVAEIAAFFAKVRSPFTGRFMHGKRSAASFEAQGVEYFAHDGRIRSRRPAFGVAVVRRSEPDRRAARRACSARARKRVRQPRRAPRRETGTRGGPRGAGETRADRGEVRRISESSDRPRGALPGAVAQSR